MNRRAIFFSLTLVITSIITSLYAQPGYDYSQPYFSLSQLGYPVESPREITFYGGDLESELPDEIPFYITPVGYRIPRESDIPDAWGETVFRWPFEIDQGSYPDDLDQGLEKGYYLYRGTMHRKETRWGTIWRGDFSDFTKPGIYQVENLHAFSVPFKIGNAVYERLERGYLDFLYNQRSGTEIPGVRPAENADDARMYSDTSQYLPLAGGWNDAGDWRKWIFLTIPNLEALSQVVRYGHPGFREKAIEEMLWGNLYYHQMINDEGRVYEDVGGGRNRAGEYSATWWNENHPGVTAAGDLESDNIPLNPVSRHVRTTYNPLVQFQYVRFQALASTVLDHPHKNNCLVLADRAWRYGMKRGHDNRTLFLSENLLAALELYLAGSPNVSPSTIGELANRLLDRQETGEERLTGYFLEKGASDGYRSIAFNAEPAMALLRLCEAGIGELEEVTDRARQAVFRYIERYLLADAATNPYGIPPYGIYQDPPYPGEQLFREAGNDRHVRTFIHVYSDKKIPHGVNVGFLHHGYLMARAGKQVGEPSWQHAAEKILHWTMGHNPVGLCLFTGVGFKHPVPASFMNYRIPSAALCGFIGRPDDTPYQETSNAIEWSTQEIWDVVQYYTIGMISYLE